MKKLLIFITLLFCNACAILEMPVNSGMSKVAYCNAKNLGAISAICNKRYYYYKDNVEVLKQGNMYAVFKNVTTPTTSNFVVNKFGNGTFVAEVYGWSEAERLIARLKPKPQKKIKSAPVNTNQGGNLKVNKLDQLIKDFESGKISRREFNKRKKELLK